MLHEDARDLKRVEELEPLERVLACGGTILLELINDILDLSRSKPAGWTCTSRPSPSRRWSRRNLHDQPAAAKNGNEIIVHCPPDVGEMHGDQTRIRQALLNLVSNANKSPSMAADGRCGTSHGRGSEEIRWRQGYRHRDVVRADGQAISRNLCRPIPRPRAQVWRHRTGPRDQPPFLPE